MGVGPQRISGVIKVKLVILIPVNHPSLLMFSLNLKLAWGSIYFPNWYLLYASYGPNVWCWGF